MQSLGLLGIALLLLFPGSTHAQSITLADLVGVWAGGREDPEYAWEALTSTDTIVFQSDSTYRHGPGNGWYAASSTFVRFHHLSGDTLALTPRAKFKLRLKGHQLMMTSLEEPGGSPWKTRILTNVNAPKPTIAATTPVPGDTMCPLIRYNPGSRDAGRLSPRDSVTFKMSGTSVKVCYGRPSLRGRTKVIGGDSSQGLPSYGRVWRTGDNEPTVLFTSAPLTLAGVKVPAGKHSLYTIPNENEDWVIIINNGTRQWGSEYDSSKDLDRGKARKEALPQLIEKFTIQPDNAANAKEILLEWQDFRIHMPVTTK